MTAQLPVRARTKLADLQDAAREAESLAGATSRRISELTHAIELNPADPEYVANTEFEISRLRAKLGEQQRRYGDLARLVMSLRGWLQQVPEGAVLTDVKPSKVKLARDETFAGAIAKVRELIATLSADKRLVESAIPPLDQVKESAISYVRELQRRGQPRVRADYGTLEISFGNGESFSNRPDVAAMLAWFDPAALTKRLLTEIDLCQQAQPGLRLSAEDKAKQGAALADQIDNLERQEEAIVEAALLEGQVFERRAAASPPAILGVAQATRKAATAA